MGWRTPSPCIVVHYHEISLKGGNRPLFLRRLGRNLLAATAGCGVRGIRRLPGRLVLDLDPDADLPQVRERIATVFGIAYFAPALSIPRSGRPFRPPCSSSSRAGPSSPSGSPRAGRSKVFPMPSDEVNRELGALVLQHFPTRVDLTQPALTVRVDLLPREAFVFVDRVTGPGGLPGGRLRAGGRSPVGRDRLAGGRLPAPEAGLRGGVRALPLGAVSGRHVAAEGADPRRPAGAAPVLGPPLAGAVRRDPAGGRARGTRPLRVVVYRRLMARIGEAIARKTGALALVTGESLGQVASQTLENIARMTEAVWMPVLRPLIGTDKEEIIREARAIGTFEISIEPDQDCCTLFVPKHPETRASAEAIAEAEARLDIVRLVEAGTASAASEAFRFPPVEASAPLSAGS